MRHFINLLLFCLPFQLVFGQEIAKIETLKIHSEELNQEREILIYTPANYTENKLVDYDVIYVFDAQNREFFDFTHSAISFLSDATRSYIVVGITSPYIEETDYARNNDLLPVLETGKAKNRFGKYSGNADHFLKYVKNEVIPYVENHYRTGYQRVAVGHSLSASFILYAMTKEPTLWNAYLAVSPNFAYDNERIARDILNFNFKQAGNIFLYLSNANEGIGYWQEWLPARKKVYSFLESSKNLENVHFVIQHFPDKTHWSTFAPALTNGLKDYFKYIDSEKTVLSDEVYDVEIRVTVPNKYDTVYVTGNQQSLGDWDPGRIRMNRVSDFERALKVKVRAPVELKFTRGSWDTEGEVKHIGGYNNIKINPGKKQEFKFEILEWADQFQ